MNILILTYHYPPSNATAGNRPNAWARELKKHGINCTVLTRHWSGEVNDSDALRRPTDEPVRGKNIEGVEIFYVPYQLTLLRKIGEKKLLKAPIARKSFYFILMCLGRINIDMDPTQSFNSFLKMHLPEHRYDGIVVTTPPFSLARLAHRVSKIYSIPYVVDFRDLWCDNKELKIDHIGDKKENISNFIIRRYIRWWIRRARMCFVVSRPMADVVKSIFAGEIGVIRNGFDKKILDKYSALTPKSEKFTITCVGTLYPEQDVNVFIRGFCSFVENYPAARIQLRLIGVGKNSVAARSFEASIDEKYLYITDRVGRDVALTELFSSTVLYIPAFNQYRGIETSKIFEYIASGRNILVAPGDGGSLDGLVRETRSGKIADSPDDVCKAIHHWYQDWVADKNLAYQGDQDVIQTFSRERQCDEFARLLKKAFK